LRHLNTLKVGVLAAGAAGAAVALGLASAPAGATPATLGFYPATDIYAPSTFHFDADSYGKGLNTDVGNSIGLTYGLGRDDDSAFGHTEVGFDYFVSPNALRAGKRLLGNVKTQLYGNSEQGTRVVAGVWGVGSKAFGAPNVGYVLGSKTFDFGRVHVGLARSFQDEAIVGNDRTNLHLAYDRALTPKLIFAVDYYTGKTTYSGVQPSLYYSVNDKASFGVGFFRANSQALVAQRNQVYLCFDYNFGGPTTAPPPQGEGGSPGAAPAGGTPTP
jgi:hypothetical protein